jgi:hypothetical protein
MKRFLLFAGISKRGEGSGLFMDEYDTIEEAKNNATQLQYKNWYEIVDSQNGEIVDESPKSIIDKINEI